MDMDDYGSYEDDYYYEDDAVDYDLMYSYAPWDWGYSETWMDQYMCADEVNEYNSYLDMTEGLSYRDECIDWCFATKEDVGGNCCASSVVFNSYDYSVNVYCAVYDTEPGAYDYMPEETEAGYAAFYSAMPLDSMMDEGIVAQAQNWVEETFGNSASKAVFAMSALIAAGTLTI